MSYKKEEINKIKIYLEKKQYNKCSDLLESLLINYIVNLIKQKNPKFEYTTIFELEEASSKYIEDERKNIAGKIRIHSRQIEPEENIYRLLEICEYYKII